MKSKFKKIIITITFFLILLSTIYGALALSPIGSIFIDSNIITTRASSIAYDNQRDSFQLRFYEADYDAIVGDYFYIQPEVWNDLDQQGSMYVQCSILDMDDESWLSYVMTDRRGSTTLVDNCKSNEPYTQTKKITLAGNEKIYPGFKVKVPNNPAKTSTYIYCAAFEQCSSTGDVMESSSFKTPIVITAEAETYTFVCDNGLVQVPDNNGLDVPSAFWCQSRECKKGNYVSDEALTKTEIVNIMCEEPVIDPCEGISCNNYEESNTIYFNGYCLDGNCHYSDVYCPYGVKDSQQISCNSPSYNCEDSDGGLIYQTQGNTKEYLANQLSQDEDDYCINNNDLREYFCNDDDNLRWEDITCEDGCSNGKCITQGSGVTTTTQTSGVTTTTQTSGVTTTTLPSQSSFCIDTDGFDAYDTKGNLEFTKNNGEILFYEDNCEGTLLNEYYCSEDGYFSINPYECPDKCEDGRCVVDEGGVIKPVQIKNLIFDSNINKITFDIEYQNTNSAEWWDLFSDSEIDPVFMEYGIYCGELKNIVEPNLGNSLQALFNQGQYAELDEPCVLSESNFVKRLKVDVDYFFDKSFSKAMIEGVSLVLPEVGTMGGSNMDIPNYPTNEDPTCIIRIDTFDECSPNTANKYDDENTRVFKKFDVFVSPETGETSLIGEKPMVYSNNKTHWCITNSDKEGYKCYLKKENIYLSESHEELNKISSLSDSYLDLAEDSDSPICIIRSTNDVEFGNVMCQEGGECVQAIKSDKDKYKDNNAIYEAIDKNIQYTSSTTLNGIFVFADILVGSISDGTSKSKYINGLGICLYEDRSIIDQSTSWVEKAFGVDKKTAGYILIGGIVIIIILLFTLLNPPKNKTTVLRG